MDRTGHHSRTEPAQYALSDNNAPACFYQASTPPLGWRRLLSRCHAKSHAVSRGLSHSRATEPLTLAVSPGQGVLTASFATRRPRVQIPSAPHPSIVQEQQPDSRLRRLSGSLRTWTPTDSCWKLGIPISKDQAATCRSTFQSVAPFLTCIAGTLVGEEVASE